MAHSFHYFSFAEVLAYAVAMGYAVDDVDVEFHDYEDGAYYDVSFGHEYTEVWSWVFHSLDEVAVDYEHDVWED